MSNLRDNPIQDALARGEAVRVITGLGVSFIVPVRGYPKPGNDNHPAPALQSGGAFVQIVGGEPCACLAGDDA